MTLNSLLLRAPNNWDIDVVHMLGRGQSYRSTLFWTIFNHSMFPVKVVLSLVRPFQSLMIEDRILLRSEGFFSSIMAFRFLDRTQNIL